MQKIIFYCLLITSITSVRVTYAVQDSPVCCNTGTTDSVSGDYDDVYSAYLNHAQEHGTVFKPKPLVWWQVVGVKVGVPLYKKCIAPVKDRLLVLWNAVAYKIRRK